MQSNFERAMVAMILAMACGVGLTSYAQYYGGGMYYHSSTAGEGYARGIGAMMSAAGDYNVQTSQAAINMTEAQRREIQNRKEWTDTYFQMREANRLYQAREAGPRATNEQMVRMAQVGKPKPLNPAEFNSTSGRIGWPSVLKMNEFEADRQRLDELFASRARNTGLTFEEQMEIRRLTADMQGALKKQLKQIPADAYMQSKRFLESLAYEATQRPG